MKTDGLGGAIVSGDTWNAQRRRKRAKARRKDARTCRYCEEEFTVLDRRGKRREVCYKPECERRRDADRSHRKHRARKKREVAALMEEN